MKNWIVLAGFSGVVAMVACGGDDRKGFVDSVGPSHAGKNSKGGDQSAAGEGGAPSGTAGTFARAGSAGKGTAMGDGGLGGAGGEGGAVDAGTPPVVAIVSPDVVTNPLGGQVLVGDNVDVTCRASNGEGPDASPLDAKSVKIAVLDAAGTVVVAEKDGLLTATPDEYAAAIPLTGVESGKVVLRCTAKSTTGALGTDTRETLADRGPKITLTAPLNDTKLALKQPVKITFSAVPQPLSVAGDTQADVASVELKVNGVAITTAPVDGMPDAYEATVDLDGPLFATKPNGNTTITLSATNKRAPNAATSTLPSSVIVDGAGPVIKVTSPASASIVGGVVRVNFTVTDAGSGVNADTVVVNFDNQKDQYGSGATWTHTGDTFVFEFDSRVHFPTTKIQIPIKVTAADNVGNSTSSASIPVYLDNVGPLVDIDPQFMRTRVGDVCSSAFDPLGDTINDLQLGKGIEMMRALVWERTNDPASDVVLHFAGTKTNSVQIAFRNPNDPKALLVNTAAPGTGTCNDIQFSDVASESINLTALTAGGNYPYTGVQAGAPVDGCASYPNSGAPSKLCGGASALSYVVGHHEYDLQEPAVYVYSPLPNTSDCTGQAWEYESLVDQDGFVCFAARATDTLGNVGVSPPVRMCVDLPKKPGQPACATTSVAPPTCSDGCTPPARGGYLIAVP